MDKQKDGPNSTNTAMRAFYLVLFHLMAIAGLVGAVICLIEKVAG